MAESFFSLAGKSAVVTGGASGIGLACVERFRAAGAEVVIADVAPDIERIAGDRGAVAVPTDVSDDDAVASLMHRTVEVFGSLDIVVNNAGVAIGFDSVVHEPDDAYRRSFEVNVLGTVHGIKHAAPLMGQGGVIINMASMAGVIGFPGYSDYAASKWSIVGLTRTAAIDLGPRGIRVNAVCPTGVRTAMGDDEAAWQGRAMTAMHQYPPSFADADDVAAAVHFLASDDARFVNGHALYVDAGLAAGPSTRLISAALQDDIFDDEGHYV